MEHFYWLLLCFVYQETCSGGLYYQCQWLMSHHSLFWLSYCFKLIGDRPIALCPFSLGAIYFHSFIVVCWMFATESGKMAWKDEISSKFYVKNEKIQRTYLFLLHLCSLSPNFDRGRRSGRPELAGSKNFMLLFPDSWKMEISEIQTRDLSRDRTEWFFHPLQIWVHQHEHRVTMMTVLIQ